MPQTNFANKVFRLTLEVPTDVHPKVISGLKFFITIFAEMIFVWARLCEIFRGVEDYLRVDFNFEIVIGFDIDKIKLHVNERFVKMLLDYHVVGIKLGFVF
jgi:hypothetical protein